MNEKPLSPAIFLVSDNSQGHTFLSKTLLPKLSNKIGEEAKAVTAKDVHCLDETITPLLFLIDTTQIWDDAILQEALFNFPQKVYTILLNVQKKMTLSEILKWRCLYGYFLKTDSQDDICKGVECITNGQSWLPRDTMTQMVDYYQTAMVSHKPAFDVELTRRELDVLQSLKTGASNMEIADELFISEHTIKSHLYNIFKKLDVKNRIQAMAWAKQHLSS